MTDKEPGVPMNFTVADAAIYMDVDTESLDLPRALEVITFLKGRIADMDHKVTELQALVDGHTAQLQAQHRDHTAHLSDRLSRARKDHSEAMERAISKMEAKVEARDHTIEVLKETIVMAFAFREVR